MPTDTCRSVVGGTTRLECRVVGDPPPDIRWFKDGRDITHNRRYSFSCSPDGNVSVLIENISHRDEGHYRCRAENSEGFASTSAYLVVRGHREFPDDVLEQVHTMQVEQDFVHTASESTLYSQRQKTDKADSDARHRRTFEQIVDEEKDIIRDGRFHTNAKEATKSQKSRHEGIADEWSGSRRAVRLEESQETSLRRLQMSSDVTPTKSVSQQMTSDIGSVWQQVTSDIGSVSQQVTSDIRSVSRQMTSDIGSVSQQVTSDIGSVSQQVTSDIRSVSWQMTSDTCTSQTSRSTVTAGSERILSPSERPGECGRTSGEPRVQIVVTAEESSSTRRSRCANSAAGTSESLSESQQITVVAEVDGKELQKGGIMTEVVTDESVSATSRDFGKWLLGETEAKITDKNAAAREVPKEGFAAQPAVTDADTSCRMPTGHSDTPVSSSLQTEEHLTIQGETTKCLDTSEASTEAVRADKSEMGLSSQADDKDSGSLRKASSTEAQRQVATSFESEENKLKAHQMTPLSGTGEASQTSERSEQRSEAKEAGCSDGVGQIPVACRLQLQRVERQQEEWGVGSVIDHPPSSLPPDSGFADSSLMESAQIDETSLTDSPTMSPANAQTQLAVNVMESSEYLADNDSGLCEVRRDVPQSLEEVRRDVSQSLEEVERDVPQSLEEVRQDVSQSLEEVGRDVSQSLEEVRRDVSQSLEEEGFEQKRAIATVIGTTGRVNRRGRREGEEEILDEENGSLFTSHTLGTSDRETSHTLGTSDRETFHTLGTSDRETSHTLGTSDRETCRTLGTSDRETCRTLGTSDRETPQTEEASQRAASLEAEETKSRAVLQEESSQQTTDEEERGGAGWDGERWSRWVQEVAESKTVTMEGERKVTGPRTSEDLSDGHKETDGRRPDEAKTLTLKPGEESDLQLDREAFFEGHATETETAEYLESSVDPVNVDITRGRGRGELCSLLRTGEDDSFGAGDASVVETERSFGEVDLPQPAPRSVEGRERSRGQEFRDVAVAEASSLPGCEQPGVAAEKEVRKTEQQKSQSQLEADERQADTERHGAAKVRVPEKEAPRVLSCPEDVRVTGGDTIRLVSQVTGNPLPEVKWFKEGDTVKDGERVTLQVADDIFTLEIRDATERDGGTYTLTAHNSQGTIFSDVLVTVSLPPAAGPAEHELRVVASLAIPDIVAQSGEVVVRELGTLQLVCTVRGKPSPSVVWSKDGEALHADTRRRVYDSQGQFYLEVPRVTLDDAGDYTCTASNSEGNVSCSIAVFVESQDTSVSAVEEGAAAVSALSQQESSSDDLFLRDCQVLQAYVDNDTGVRLTVGELVEVLDSRQKSGAWLVRRQSQREQVCFVPSSYLRPVQETKSESADLAARRPDVRPVRSPPGCQGVSSEWLDTSEDEDRMRLRENFPVYVVVAEYTPPQSAASGAGEPQRLTEGQLVEVMDMERCDRWLVQTRPTKSSAARHVWVPPAYLEARTSPLPLARRSTREVFREDVLQISNKQQEAVLKRSQYDDEEKPAFSPEYAVTELVETEREYIRELQQLLNSYYKKLGRRTTPAVLRDKRDLIFSNISDILDFHNDVFVSVLQASSTSPVTVGDCFLIKASGNKVAVPFDTTAALNMSSQSKPTEVEKKFSMYVSYWTDHLTSAAYLEDEEAQEFLKGYSRSIGDSELTFPRLLQAPVDRLRTYQTLLRDILRYTARAGEDGTSLVKALTMLADIERQVMQRQVLHSIQGLTDDVTSLGQLVRHDDVVTWESEAPAGRGKDRHVFLFRDKLVVTKRKRMESPLDRAVFLLKNVVELPEVRLHEQVREDERRFELLGAATRGQKLTVQTRHSASRQAWCRDIRELLTSLGIEETDVMPEKISATSPTSPEDQEVPPASPPPRKKVTSPDGVPAGLGTCSESDTERTVTDDCASLSSYDSDISGFQTAAEREDPLCRPVFKKRPEKTVCQEGSTGRLECEVTGTPRPSVTWLKNGAAISSTDNIRVISEGDTSTLVISVVSQQEAGHYTALAANTCGSTFATAELVLEDLNSTYELSPSSASAVQLSDLSKQQPLEQEGVSGFESKGTTTQTRGLEVWIAAEVQEGVEEKSGLQLLTSADLGPTTSVEAKRSIRLSASVDVESHRTTEQTSDLELSASVDVETHRTTEQTSDLELSASVDVESHRTTEKTSDLELSASVDVQSHRTTEKTSDLELLAAVDVESHRTTEQTSDLEVSASVDVESQSTTKQTSDLELSASVHVESPSTTKQTSDLELSASVDVESHRTTETSDLELSASVDVEPHRTTEKTSDLQLSASVDVEPHRTTKKTSDLQLLASVDVEPHRTTEQTSDLDLLASVDVESQRSSEQTSVLELSASVDVESQRSSEQTSDLELSASVDVETLRTTEQTSDLELLAFVDVESQRTTEQTSDLELSASVDVESQSTTKQTSDLELSASVDVESHRTTETSDLELSASVDVEPHRTTEKTSDLQLSASVDVEPHRTTKKTSDLQLLASVDVEPHRTTEQTSDLDLLASVDVESQRSSEQTSFLELSASVDVESQRSSEQTSDLELSASVDVETLRTTEQTSDLELLAFVDVESQRTTEQTSDLELSASVDVETLRTTEQTSDLELLAFVDVESQRTTEQTSDLELSASVDVESQSTTKQTSDLELSASVDVESQNTTKQTSDLVLSASVDVESQRSSEHTSDLELSASVDVESQRTTEQTSDLELSASVDVETHRTTEQTSNLELSASVDVEPQSTTKQTSDLELSASVDVESQRSCEQTSDLELSAFVDVESQRTTKQINDLELSASVDVETHRTTEQTSDLELSASVDVESQKSSERTSDLVLSTSVDVESQSSTKQTSDLVLSASVDVELQRTVEEEPESYLKISTFVDVESQSTREETPEYELLALPTTESRSEKDKDEFQKTTAVEVESKQLFEETRHLHASTSASVEAQRTAEDEPHHQVATFAREQPQSVSEEKGGLNVLASVGVETHKTSDKTYDLDGLVSAEVAPKGVVEKKHERETSAEVELQRTTQRTQGLELLTSVAGDAQRTITNKKNFEDLASELDSLTTTPEKRDLKVSALVEVESQTTTAEKPDLKVSALVEVESQTTTAEKRDLEVCTSVEVESQTTIVEKRDLKVSASNEVESQTTTAEKRDLEVFTTVEVESQTTTAEKRDLEVFTTVEVESQTTTAEKRDLEVCTTVEVESQTTTAEKRDLEVFTTVEVESQTTTAEKRDLEVCTTVVVDSQSATKKTRGVEVSASVEVESQSSTKRNRDIEASASDEVESQTTTADKRDLDVYSSAEVESQRTTEKLQDSPVIGSARQTPTLTVDYKVQERRLHPEADSDFVSSEVASAAVSESRQTDIVQDIKTAKGSSDTEVGEAVTAGAFVSVSEPEVEAVVADVKETKAGESAPKSEVKEGAEESTETQQTATAKESKERQQALQGKENKGGQEAVDDRSAEEGIVTQIEQDCRNILSEQGSGSRFAADVLDSFSQPNAPDRRQRLKVFETTTDGEALVGPARTEGFASSVDTEVLERPPHFIAEMNDVVVELGQIARFDCRVAAYPDPEITWLKDGNKVIPTDRYVLQSFHDDIFSLLIKDTKVEDSGCYTCLAKNQYGEAKTEALLNVLPLQGELEEGDMAPAFVTKFGNVECIEGVPVEFTCQISGRPPATVTWLINGREVTPSLELLTRQKDDTIMLAFRSVQLEHSGDIVCKLKNHLGEATCRAKLRVAEDLSKKGECPLFVERPSDLEVAEGGDARFDCVITGTPIPEVLWYFNGRELFDSRRRSIVRRGDRHSLILREVIADNAGVYTCKAVNAAGDASFAVELSVKEIPKELPRREEDAQYTFPPTFTRRPADQRTAPGRTARFECMMLGIPFPDVEWQKNGRPLTPSDKYKMGRAGSTAILGVSDVQPEDSGEYTCVLHSSAGKASSRAALQVQEEPKPRFASPAPRFEARIAETRAPSKGREFSPLITRPARELTPEEKVPFLPFDKPALLDIRGDSVKVTWLPARTSDLPDNARRVAYTLEARELPSNRWTRLASDLEGTSYVARDLRPDREYLFRVYAENKYGPSDVTLPATLPVREEPKIVRQLFAEETAGPLRFPAAKPYVMDIGEETVRIGWHPAELEGRPHDVSYRVEAQKLPSEDWIPLASRVRDTSLYLSDLEPDRDYNIRVRAQGSYGVSQPTPPVWLPRATAFAGVPVMRPQITEMEPGAVRLQWQRVDVPTFSHEQEPLLYMIEMQEPPSAHWREVANRIPETYYVIHDLVPATDYRFRIRAETRDGARSEPSPATSVYRTLALSRPPVDRLEVTEYESDFQTVGLSWSRVDIPPFDSQDEPLLYMIEYREPQADAWHTLVSGIPTTRYRVPDIGPAHDYQFRVRAMTPYGLSPPSHPAGLYRHSTPLRPLAQDLHVSSLESDSMRLSWQPMALPSSTRSTPSRVSYQVEALEYPSTQWRPLATDVRDTTYQLQGLQPTKDYSFRVCAVTPSGLTEPSTPVTLTSLPVRPRLQGHEPSVSLVGPDSARLQWRAAELPYYSRHTTPVTYTVEMQEVPGHTWLPVRRNVPDTSYLVTSLRPDRDYRFRVRPESEFGPGESSKPVHVYRRAAAVTMPGREPIISDIGPNSITLSWKPAQVPAGYQPARPVSYRVEMREPPSGHWLPIGERLTGTSHRVNFLSPDKDYMFRLVAELDGAESEPTGSAFLPHRAGPPRMLREPPLISSVHPDSVWLSWRSVDIPSRITDYAPVTYRVEAQEPPLMEWRPVARHIPHTHHHVTGLRPGQEYNFRVRAENDYGLSDPTPSIFLKKRSVPPVMPQQEPLISDVSPGSLRLTWRPADVPSYLLDSVPITYSIQYQHLPDTEWLPLARRVAGNSYFVTGLSPDNNYTFRISAENDFGSSRPTLPARMPRLADIPSPIYSPQIQEVEPTAVRLAWKSPRTGPYKAPTTTYAVEALEPSTWTWRPLVSRLPTPTYRVTSLAPTEDYIFRIRAETEKALSEPSFPVSYSGLRAFPGILDKKTAAPPAVPVERPILSEIESDSVRVSWHPVHYPLGGAYRDSKKRYRLEMRELPHGQWHPVVHQTPQWNYEVTGLRPGSDYAFRVILVTDDGSSPPSNAAYLYRRPVIPRLPVDSPEVEEVTDDAVFLRWNRVDVPAFDTDEEPLSFMIEAQRLPSYDWEPVARGVKDTSYRVTGLQPRQDYAFRLRAETSAGITKPTTPLPVYRRPERAGVPISYVTVDDQNVPPYSARLRWTPVYLGPYSSPAGTSYLVEMREPRQPTWHTLASDVHTPQYLVSDLSPRKTYMFRVRARSPAGELSDPSIPVPFYPLHMRHFTRQPGPDALAIVEDYSLPSRAYLEALIVKVPPRMPIEKPDVILVDPQTVHLTWNAARVPKSTSSLSPTSYRVEAREDGTASWVERVAGLRTLSCDIRGLKPHLDYAFRVRAVNDFGWSEPTLPAFLHRPIEISYDEPLLDWETFTPTVPPIVAPRLPIDSPRLLPVTKDTVRVVWHPARTPAYARRSPITYVVEMKEPTAPVWRPLASSLQDVSYQVSGLEPLRSYLFRVRAESEFGTSEPTLPAELSREIPKARSSSVDRQTPTDYDLSTRRGSYIDSITAGVPPRVPSGRPTISDVTGTGCTLSWPATRLPAYLKKTKLDYVIEFRETPSHQWSTFAENIPDTTYRVTGLEPNQDYMFRVRSHNDYGTSEPTLPAILEREKRSSTPQRRGSSVERRSLDKRSADRLSSERRSLARRSLDPYGLDRRSESAPRRKEGARKPDAEDEASSGMAPDETPMAPAFSSTEGEDVQHGVESHPLTVTLRLRGYPPPQVTWYHKNKELELGDRIDSYITPTGQVFLEFLSMGWQDVGDYRCVAKNDLGRAEKNVRVEVADPPTFLEPLGDIRVAERSQATLTCRVDGIPPPTVKFTKDWRPVTTTSRVMVTNDLDRWTLTLTDVLPADSGTYMCVAENVAGKVVCTAKVSVEDDLSSDLSLGFKPGCLEDNYYVLQELGRGRHGRVRRVLEKATGREFAAKFIQVRDAADKEFFRCELHHLWSQSHSNIVKVHDAYETPRQLIIVSELLPGGELLDRAVSYGNWTERRAAAVVRQLLNILQHVHSHNIVHMDIKPSNLLLSGDSIESVKLIDFGFARKLSPSQDTYLNYGTPGFASPEAIDVKPISTASDVWGVGVLAYILLCGQSPFQADSVGDSLRRARDCQWSFEACSSLKDVSQEARDFISQILRKDPQERPSVEACLAHPWLSGEDTGVKVDVSLIKDFQERDKAQRRATAARSAAYLRSLQRLMAAPETQERGLRPTVDPSSGTIRFPDTEAYGEFLDSESWYDWQSQYGQSAGTDIEPEMRGVDRDRLKAKENVAATDVDKDELPAPLARELQWLQQRAQPHSAQVARGPPRQDSTDSRRSSVSTDGETASVPVFRQRLHDLTFQTGDIITMYCELEGPPPYSTVWYKNEELLTDGNRVKLALYEQGQATLTISAAKPYDAGVYRCVARNKAGRSSSRMRLLLGDVPERPGWPVVTQVSAQDAVVIWEAPRFDGNFPIQGYRVDYKARGDSRWITAVHTPLEVGLVAGLQPLTSYRFRVSASNLLGRGPFSWSTAEVTTTKEGCIREITSGDVTLQELTTKQEKEEELVGKRPEPEVAEDVPPAEESAITLQAVSPETEYAFGDVIWKGRFGEFRECRSKKTSQHALVKVVPPQSGRREYDLLRSLRHESLLRLLDAFCHRDTCYLVFQAASGEHVLQRLSLRRRYSEENVAHVIRQALYGLQYLHRHQVAHLNLQPVALVLTTARGLDLKLSDFSLMQTLPGPEGLLVPRRGHPDFLAPEVVVREKAGSASDVWSVGTLTFLLLSGLSPFLGASDGETLVNVAYCRYDVCDLQDGVSSEALRFLYKVMKRIPRNRPSVQECLEHRWLQLTDSMSKTREANLIRSNRLRTFVLQYDRQRQSPDYCDDFDDIVLPPGLAAGLEREADWHQLGCAQEETGSLSDEDARDRVAAWIARGQSAQSPERESHVVSMEMNEDSLRKIKVTPTDTVTMGTEAEARPAVMERTGSRSLVEPGVLRAPHRNAFDESYDDLTEVSVTATTGGPDTGFPVESKIEEQDRISGNEGLAVTLLGAEPNETKDSGESSDITVSMVASEGKHHELASTDGAESSDLTVTWFGSEKKENDTTGGAESTDFNVPFTGPEGKEHGMTVADGAEVSDVAVLWFQSEEDENYTTQIDGAQTSDYTVSWLKSEEGEQETTPTDGAVTSNSTVVLLGSDYTEHDVMAADFWIATSLDEAGPNSGEGLPAANAEAAEGVVEAGFDAAAGFDGAAEEGARTRDVFQQD